MLDKYLKTKEMWQSSKPPSFNNDSGVFGKKDEFLQVENMHSLNDKLNEKLSNMNATGILGIQDNKSGMLNSHERFTDRLNEKIPPKPKKLTPIFSRKSKNVTQTAGNNNEVTITNFKRKELTSMAGAAAGSLNRVTNGLVDSLIIDDGAVIGGGTSTTNTTVSSTTVAVAAAVKNDKDTKNKKLRKDIQTITYHSNSDDDPNKTNQEDDEAGEESEELDLDKDNANKLVNLYNCNRGVQAIPNNAFDFIWDSQKFMNKLNEEDQKQQQLQSTSKKIEEHVSGEKGKSKASLSGKGPKLLSDDFKYVRNPEITIMLNLEKKKTKKVTKKKTKNKKSKSTAAAVVAAAAATAATSTTSKSILSSGSSKKLNSDGEILVEDATLSNNDVNTKINSEK
jgi:hypothetical protein